MRRFPVVLVLIALGCSSGAHFNGLAPAEATGGPKVLFDLARKPLPEIPFPSDLATRPNPDASTGTQVNLPIPAPTQLEQRVRALIDTLGGFGTFAPITVAFDGDLDVEDLYARQNDADPGNDGVYLIDLTTGARLPLDFNGGHFPVALADPGQYFENDPLSGVRNLLFPADNVLHPGAPQGTPREQVDSLVTFYERASRTLIVRPILPLAQERRHAVVLTKRLRGKNGRAVTSPHDGINHAAQTDQLRPLLDFLPPGVALGDVAYAWSFTTQPVTRDLERIRDGFLVGGPLAPIGVRFPTAVGAVGGGYFAAMDVLQEKGVFDPNNPSTNKGDYRVSPDELAPLLTDPAIAQLLPFSAAEMAALLDSYKHVDYFVNGSFASPNLLDANRLGDPADKSFQIDLARGTLRAQAEIVTFTLAVPKQRLESGHMAPFPVVIAGHGYQSSRLEDVLAFGGSFAKFGLATISIDAYGHGLALDPFSEAVARGIARSHGLEPFADAIFKGRARDLDNDGVKDPGGDFWGGNPFHTRDVVRQSIVDWLQLVRLLRTFDGAGAMVIGNVVARAGDFNGDLIPDLGGAPRFPQDVYVEDPANIPPPQPVFRKNDRDPGADTFVFGISLGGILSGILPALEPAILAAAPVSGGGGLSDIALRSTLQQVVQAVYLEVFGPLLVSCPWDPQAGPIDWQATTDPTHPARFGGCGAAGPQTLALVAQDVNRERDLPLAQLSLAKGDVVVVRNLAQTSLDCTQAPVVDGCSRGTASDGGALRLPVAADWPLLQVTRTPRPAAPDQVNVEVLRPGDPLQITILPAAGGAPIVIDKLGIDFTFMGVKYAAGSGLVSPAHGYGLDRNTPAFRRLVGLSQLALDPGDPVNYAPHWFKDLLPARTTAGDSGLVSGPANVLVVGTAGDPAVPVSTAIAMARAAGIVEISRPDPAFGLPVDQVLIKSFAVEGVANLQRPADSSPQGPAAQLPGHIDCSDPSACTGDAIVDVTGYGCNAFGTACTDRFEGGAGAPRLTPPLRDQLIVQSARGGTSCPVSSRGQLTSGCWSTGTSACLTDGNGRAAPGVSALMLPYLSRAGQHGFRTPQPQKAFDVDTFMINVIGRYFECRGRELRFDACQAKPSSTGPGVCDWIPPPP